MKKRFTFFMLLFVMFIGFLNESQLASKITQSTDAAVYQVSSKISDIGLLKHYSNESNFNN